MVERIIEDPVSPDRNRRSDIGRDLGSLEIELKSLPSDAAQARRVEIIGQTVQFHATALIVSAELEAMGYDPSIEVPEIIALPRILGQDAIVSMAIARRAARRELALHPDDSTKLLIVARKSTLY